MGTFHRGFLALSCFLALGSFPSCAAASAVPASDPARVSGVVTDPSGSAVANALVSLETSDGQSVASTVTDGSGQYHLTITGRSGVRYRERVVAPGFRTAVEENLLLPDGASRLRDIHLTIGSNAETVDVNVSETKANGEIATVAQAGILGTLNESDLPYSVSSYTAQLVLDQQAQTESDVLRNEVGIQEGNGRYSEDQYMTLRGFVLDPGQSLLNGMPELVDARSPSIENIDRVEIFKGPTSFINGASAYGAPGGIVNMVTKRAGDQPYYRFDGGYASKNELEGHLDLGRRFLPQNALGIRLTLGGREGNTPVDNQEENVAAGGLNMDYRGEKLHASTNVSDQARSMLGYRSAIYVDPGFAIPKAPKMTSNLYDHAASYTHHGQVVLTQGEYDFTDHLGMFGSYGYHHESESYIGPGLDYLTDAQGDVTVYDLPFTSDVHNNVGRLGARLTTSTGPIHHEITLAGDYVQVLSGYFYEYGDTYQTNLYAPVALAPLDPRVAGLKNVPNTDLTRLSSVALADVATALHDKLIVIGGLRGQWIGEKEYGTVSRSASNTPDFTPCTEACSYNQGVPSPSIAAMYHLPKGFSVYGNYVQDLQQGPSSPQGATNQNEVFAPYVAKQGELGAKFDHGAFESTFAIYQIGKPDGVLNPTTNTFGITGQQRNRGIEFTLAGNILPGLRANGGVSFLDARQIGTGLLSTEGKRAQGVPGTESTVNFEWTVPRIKSLNLDARMSASSGQWVDTAETQSIPAWARLDIGGRYSFETRFPVTVRVNIDNVTGANYFESGLLGLAYTGPRTLRLSTGLRF